jgi:hypothetical protein
VQNSEGGGDSDGTDSFVDPLQELKNLFFGCLIIF